MSSTPVRLSDPAEIAAAVPVLLGFHPHDSAVLISFDEHDRIGPILRSDLPPLGTFEPVAAQMVDTVPAGYRAAVVVLVVSEQPRSDALADLARTATAARMAVLASIYTTTTAPGAVWTCCCGCAAHGRLPQPHPELVAPTAAGGRPTLPSREALAATLSPADPPALARRAALLRERADHADQRPAVDLEAALDAALTSGAARTGQLGDDEVIALVGALGDQRRARQVLLARTEDLAELLPALVRATPAPYVAVPAVFLALAALLRGDGALAEIAVDVARAADPQAPLTRVADELLAGCPSPARVRELLTRP